MTCYHCGSTALYRDTDEHGLPEVTCIICGREQLRIPPDTMSPRDSDWLEQQFAKQARKVRVA